MKTEDGCRNCFKKKDKKSGMELDVGGGGKEPMKLSKKKARKTRK